jgi:hypothetical protein
MGGATEQRKFHTKELDVAKTATPAPKAPAAAAVVAKSLYSVGDLADLLSAIRWIQEDSRYEAEYEGDGSPVPDKLKAWMADGIEILVEMAREEGSEAVAAMKSTVAKYAPTKVAKVKKNPMATAKKALDSMGECMGKTCKCQDMGKCMEKMVGAHQDACDAVDSMDEPEDKDSAGKAAGAAAGAAPITTQGASPETGAEDMDEAQKAELALAAKNSAEALEIAKANQAGQETIMKAVGTILQLITNEPVAPKSVGPQAPVTPVSKSQENGGAAPPPASATPESTAKSIFATGGKVLTRQEEHQLNIGR